MIKNEIEKRIIINEHTSMPMESFNNSLWTQKRRFSEYEAWILLLVDCKPLAIHDFCNGTYKNELFGTTSKYIGYYTKKLQWSKKEVSSFFDYLCKNGYITTYQESISSKINITIHNYDKYVLLNLKSK